RLSRDPANDADPLVAPNVLDATRRGRLDMTKHGKSSSRLIKLGVTLLTGALVGFPAMTAEAATPLACGALVDGPGDYVLTQDCTNRGLVVLADDVTIDLGGFTLSGNGGEGIVVVGSRVEVSGGQVNGFDRGIVVEGAADVQVLGVGMSGNGVAIEVIDS